MDKKAGTNILLIEADENLLITNRRVLQRALGSNTFFECVRTLNDAKKILSDKTNAFDLILLGIILPDGSGLEFIPTLHALSDAPTLILSAKSTPIDVIEGIEKGGDNYIALPYEPEVMATLVSAMLNREKKREPIKTAIPSITIVRDKLTLDLIAKRAYISGIDARLNKKDFDLLSLLVRDEGKAISADRLYEIIWKSEIGSNKRMLQKQISTLSAILENGDSGYRIRDENGEKYCFESTK